MSSLKRLGAALVGALSLTLLLASQQSAHAQTTFTNGAPIEINDGTFASPGNPYPSNINVSGLPGSVSKVSVQLHGFTHSFPTDVDLLLVAPNGQGVILMSDAGGGSAVAEMSVGFDDAAAGPIPAEGPLDSGTYKPTDYDGFGSEEFPPTAPSGPYATTLSALDGINPNGTWGLYVVDDQQGDSGQVTGGWSITITIPPPTPVNPGDVVISEFRLRGPMGADDEFIELGNRTANDIVVGASDGSSGWAVVASDGVTRFVVPNGTRIPAYGHFLAVNADGYSLSNHPAGTNRTAKGDATFTAEIPDGAGLALFKTASPAGFTLANRLDAVGFAGVADALYKEGAGLSPATGIVENSEHTFARRLAGGPPNDSDDNEANFWFINTSAATLSGRGSILGAPGPENLSSPTLRNSTLPMTIIDTAVSSGVAPNRVRDTTPYAIGPNGTLALRRLVTNYTGVPLRRIRARVMDITIKGAGGGLNGVSDVRVLSAPTARATLSDGRVVKLHGMTLEQPPAQGTDGGGLNSTLTLTLDEPLQPGESVYVQMLFGIMASGTFRVYVNTEGAP